MCHGSGQSVSHRQRIQLQPAWSYRTQAQWGPKQCHATHERIFANRVKDFHLSMQTDRQHLGVKEAPTCQNPAQAPPCCPPQPEVPDSTRPPDDLHYHPPMPQRCWDAKGPDRTLPPLPARQQSSFSVLLVLRPSLEKVVQSHPPCCPPQQQPARKRSSASILTGYNPEQQPIQESCFWNAPRHARQLSLSLVQRRVS